MAITTIRMMSNLITKGNKIRQAALDLEADGFKRTNRICLKIIED